MNELQNEPALSDEAVIARLRSALDEVTEESHGLVSTVAPRPTVSAGRWLAIAAAVVLIVGGVAAIAISRGSAPDLATTPTELPSTSTTEPELIRVVTPRYTLASADLVPGEPNEVSGDPTTGWLSMAWSKATGVSDGLLVMIELGEDATAAATNEFTLRSIDGAKLLFLSYALDTAQREELAAQVVPGSGLPYLLPVEGWELLALGRESFFGEVTAGQHWSQDFTNERGSVTLSVGDYSGEFSELLGKRGELTPVTVAGIDGWRSEGESGTLVVWPAGESGKWASLRIPAVFADRVDGLIAAVAEIADNTPTVDTVPVPPASDAAESIGRLQIPAIGLDLTVVDPGGSFEDAKQQGPVLVAGPLPGGDDSVAIVWGERTTFGAPFGRLDELKSGDTITWVGLEGTVTFEVIAVRSSDDPDAAVIPEGTTLQLRTFTPEYTSQQVLVVYARTVA